MSRSDMVGELDGAMVADMEGMGVVVVALLETDFAKSVISVISPGLAKGF